MHKIDKYNERKRVMEKIMAFYEKLNYYDRNQNWIYKFLQYMMGGFYILFMLLAVDQQFIKESWINTIDSIMFLGFTIYARLAPFTLTKEKGRNVPVIKKLRYTPVNHKLLLKFMGKILVRYVIRLTAICIVLQIILGSLVMGTVTWWNILYPLAVGSLGLVIGYCMIKIN